VSSFFNEIRYALRSLLKRPGFTSVVVLVLALGIGANTALFSLVNAVLLRPLPYRDPDRLVMVWEDVTALGFPRNTPAPANYLDWKAQSTAFEKLVAYDHKTFNLTGWGEPERIDGERVAADLFSLLGVAPALGRAFLPAEDRAGAPSVALISDGLWRRRFGADPALMGRAITLDTRPVLVVGVMPRGFHFPSRKAEIWVPLAMDEKESANRGGHYLEVVGRLAPGLTLSQAQAEMEAIAARLQKDYLRTNTNVGAVVVPLHEELVGESRPALLVLLGAVAFVLLIACANVANLLLARGASREREIAVRAALGAGRGRLIRQFLTESLILSLTGGAAGIGLAAWGVRFLGSLVPESLASLQGPGLDTFVLIFCLGLSLLTGLLFGIGPALQVSRVDLIERLKEGSLSRGSGRNRMRGALVVSEIALALLLLAGAGVMLKSFARLRGQDPGFRPDRLLTIRMVLSEAKYPGAAERRAFYDRLLGRVASLPGVESEAMVSYLPLTFTGGHYSFSIEGSPVEVAANLPTAVYRTVSPEYFETMGIPLFRGRGFTEQDREGTPPVVVIDRILAERFWPGQDAVAKRLKLGEADSSEPWQTVVGVVGNVRQIQLSAELKPAIYVSYHQELGIFSAPHDLVVRTAGDPMALAATVRSQVWEVDRDQPVSDIQTMDQILAANISRPRFSSLLLGAFAAAALLLAAVGIYGVISYLTEQRTREMGIRLALGADRRDILKMVLGTGLRLTLGGVAAGLAGALALGRLLSSLLYGVSASDPLTLAGVSVLLASVSLIAAYLPARRAVRVDPVVALRYE